MADYSHFSDRGRLLHMIYTQQFSREVLGGLFDVAEAARRLYRSRVGASVLRDCLPNRRALLYFVQPSTRTFLSFQAAASILGMPTAQVTSTKTSSEYKGESPADSVRTFAMCHDLIIMRYPEPGFAEECALSFTRSGINKHIINGGSGMDQHPTQALLDVYTLHREFFRRGGIDGKRILVVGDLARGRTVRSLIYLLGLYSGVQVDLVSPESLAVKDDMKQYMSEIGMSFRESRALRDFAGDADAIYMTRIQDEYEKLHPTGKVDYGDFRLTDEILGLLRPDCVILHPLPRRDEIPVSVDADPRSRYWDQVENGMWARVALIAHMLSCDLQIQAA